MSCALSLVGVFAAVRVKKIEIVLLIIMEMLEMPDILALWQHIVMSHDIEEPLQYSMSREDNQFFQAPRPALNEKELEDRLQQRAVVAQSVLKQYALALPRHPYCCYCCSSFASATAMAIASAPLLLVLLLSLLLLLPLHSCNHCYYYRFVVVLVTIVMKL